GSAEPPAPDLVAAELRMDTAALRGPTRPVGRVVRARHLGGDVRGSPDRGGAARSMKSALSPETRSWLARFIATPGRVPRVLHIGNIANNAYNIAALLNGAGLDCDVICYDYYHVMGCPEWEDADFTGRITDQSQPDWSALDLRGFERPRWFAQGPLSQCIDYLIAKRSGDSESAEQHWATLGASNRTIPRGGGDPDGALMPTAPPRTFRRRLRILLDHPDVYSVARRRFHSWD